MNRVATLTSIVKTCGDCMHLKKWMMNGIPHPTSGFRCGHAGKNLEGVEEIPEWCPLPCVVEVEAKDIVKEIEHKKEESND
jgi:hypothetical protein